MSDIVARSRLYLLPQEVRDEVLLLEQIFTAVDAAGHVRRELAAVAARYDGRRGYTIPSLIRKFYAWKHSGQNPMALVDRARIKDRADTLPAEFLEYWKSLCERNQRKCRPAYRELLRLYQAGENIPGYGCKDSNVHEIPAGWSYGNLMRFKPSRFELTARRIGRSAAADFRPLVFTTRVGLQAGQFYVFDDLEHDLKVNFLGVNRAAMRPLELACLDLFSGCKIAYGIKPTTVNDETGSKEKLKEREMRFLVAHILHNIGYRPEGTKLVVEHGTAAIREDIERIVLDATDGAVTVSRSGIEGDAAFDGVYRGRPHGNSRFKSPLESHWNLVHNETAMLPGQVGKDRNHQPEELYGREAHNTALVKAFTALTEERARLLKLPFIPWQQFLEIYAFISDRINARTDHHLEGWEAAGLVVNEFRLLLDSTWMPMGMLPALASEERGAVEAVIGKPGHVRCRRMSPSEVWKAGCTEFSRIGKQFVPAILGKDLGVPRPVLDDHLFRFQDRDVGPGEHRYLATVRDIHGCEVDLKPGETYLTHVNPFNLDELFVSELTKSGMQFIGVAPLWKTVRRDDTEALHRQMGAAAHVEAELLAPVARRGADLTRRRIAESEHNAAVLAGAPITGAEKSRAEAMDRFEPASLIDAESHDEQPGEDTRDFDPSKLL